MTSTAVDVPLRRRVREALGKTTLIGDVPEATAKNQTGRWGEDLPRLWPEDLYRAQCVARRTAP